MPPQRPREPHPPSEGSRPETGCAPEPPREPGWRPKPADPQKGGTQAGSWDWDWATQGLDPSRSRYRATSLDRPRTEGEDLGKGVREPGSQPSAALLMRADHGPL
eukprot:scaffold9250_cov105-Isochrysis_galbana.AAC.15